MLVEASTRSYKKYLLARNREFNKLYSDTLMQVLSDPILSLKVRERMKYIGPFFISSDSDKEDLAGIREFVSGYYEITYLAMVLSSGDNVLIDASLGITDKERSGKCLDYDSDKGVYIKIRCQPFNKEEDIVTGIRVVNLDGEYRPNIVPVDEPRAPGDEWRVYLEARDSEGDNREYLLKNSEAMNTPTGYVKTYEDWLYDKYWEMGGPLYNEYPLNKIKNWAITQFVDFTAQQGTAWSMPASLFYETGPLDDFEIMFPALMKCWDEVKDRVPTDALVYLKGKADSTKRSISLFGIQIEYGFLFFAGPIVIFVLLVMLSTTLRHALASLKEKGDWKEIAGFSWFGLSSQILPRVMMFTSIVVLPFSVAVLAVILDQGAASYFHVLVLVLCLATLAPAFDVVRALKKLRLMAAEAVSTETSPKKPAHLSFRRRNSRTK